MESLQILDNLLEDMALMLESFLVTGFLVCSSRKAEGDKLIKECRRIGLTSGADLLEAFYKELDNKRNNLDYDDDKLIKSYCRLASYINLAQEKYRLIKVEVELE